MKICVAQTRPITGDIPGNIRQHLQVIRLAVADGAELMVFPELSLTGYEPALAKDLAMEPVDSRLDEFQTISNAHGITIGVGVPIRDPSGICISMVLCQPHQNRRIYSKSYLHPDEEPFFVRGRSLPHLRVGQINVALAICYEISVPEHLTAALESKPDLYVASVAKFVNGIGKASARLAEIARLGTMPVTMSNCVGWADGGQCAGSTAAWTPQGTMLEQLNDTDEGYLLFDTSTQDLISRTW